MPPFLSDPSCSARRRRAGWAVVLGLLAASGGLAVAAEPDSSAEPQEVRLQTADGRRFVGTLVRDVPSHVLLNIGGVDARFERAEIERVSAVTERAAASASVGPP